MRLFLKFIVVTVLIVLILSECDAKKRKKSKKNSKQMILRQKETNPVNFIRLAVMRLIYGIATRIGFGEQISEALNGAFVPPGAEDYDGFGGADGFFDRDDDYDY